MDHKQSSQAGVQVVRQEMMIGRRLIDAELAVRRQNKAAWDESRFQRLFDPDVSAVELEGWFRSLPLLEAEWIAAQRTGCQCGDPALYHSPGAFHSYEYLFRVKESGVYVLPFELCGSEQGGSFQHVFLPVAIDLSAQYGSCQQPALRNTATRCDFILYEYAANPASWDYNNPHEKYRYLRSLPIVCAGDEDWDRIQQNASCNDCAHNWCLLGLACVLSNACCTSKPASPDAKARVRFQPMNLQWKQVTHHTFRKNEVTECEIDTFSFQKNNRVAIGQHPVADYFVYHMSD